MYSQFRGPAVYLMRHPRLRAPFEISAASVAGFRASLDALGFTEIHTPKIVPSATESGATVFGPTPATSTCSPTACRRRGGFAIGLERWTARLTGAANIRQTALFPRDLHRLSP
jgi:aspartyl/asparaginyl-tRNA synthetase